MLDVQVRCAFPDPMTTPPANVGQPRASGRRWLPPFIESWILTIPFALLPTFVAIVHVAPGFPPAPALLLRIFLMIAGGSLLLYAILTRFTSPQAVVAAVGLSMSAVGFFSTARDFFYFFFGTGDVKIFSALYLLACVLIAVVVVRSKPPALNARYDTVRLMAGLLTGVAVIVLAYYYVVAPLLQPALGWSNELGTVSVQSQTTRPDVYHIVLDGFGRPDILQAQYGLDLSEFVRQLTVRGFEVAQAAGAANYTQTYLSLASMLNAQYLEALAAAIADSHSRVPLTALIQRSGVLEAFKRLQYQIVFLGSIYSATQRHRLADQCECEYVLFGEFESVILHSTPLGELSVGGVDYRPHRSKIRRTFETLESLTPARQPRFLFAHMMSPHPPFVFDADGRDVAPRRPFALDDGTMYRGTLEEYQRGYREQAKYIASRILGVIDHIDRLSKASQRESVIIIHGDHGPRARFDAGDATKTDASESLPVLLAIRWAPTGQPDEPVTTLVNVYRSFFRRYSSTNLQLLPDRSFVSSFAKPYQMIEIDRSIIDGRSGRKRLN